jgi:cobalt-zinc-cadmium efflux system outer membrane protein
MKYLEFSRSPFGRRRILLISAVLVVGVILFSANGRAQETQTLQESLSFKSPSMAEHAGMAVSLRELVKEAEQNNPQIQAARQGWQAAKQVPSQVSTLPDPQFNLQQVNVGSPRPFAGYTNSDFAYIGLGVSQDFPYPGKLRLKGEIAKRDADLSQQGYEAVRRSVLAGVKTTYFQLAYLSKTLGILESDGQLLQQVEKAADARYRSGMGNQQDLLQAQLERTRLLREITMHHLEVAKLQAQLKELLNRSQSSPDIEPVDLGDSEGETSIQSFRPTHFRHYRRLLGVANKRRICYALMCASANLHSCG